MPRLRLTGSTIGYSPSSGASGGSPAGEAVQYAGRSMAEVGGLLAERESRLAEARRKRDYFRGRLRIEELFQGVDDEFRDDEEFGTLERRAQDRVAGARDAFLQDVGDAELRKDLGAEFDLYGVRWLGQFRKETFRRERDASVAGFDADTNNYLNRYINAPDETTRAAMLRDYENALSGMDEWLTPGESAERAAAFRRAGDYGRARADIERTKGSFDPTDYQHLNPDKVAVLREYAEKVHGKAQVARAIEGASAMLDAEDPESLRRAVDAVRGAGLDEEQQAQAVRAVKADYSLGVTIATQKRQQAEDDAWDGFLAARDEGAPLGVKDVLAMDIGAGQKRAMIATLEADVKAARGEETKTNIKRYFQIQDAIEGRKIKTRGQLLTLAGGKVSNDDLKTLESQWTKHRDESGQFKPMTVLKARAMKIFNKDEEKIFKYQMAVDYAVRVQEKKEGRSLLPNEIVEVGLDMLAKTYVTADWDDTGWGVKEGSKATRYATQYEQVYADSYGGFEASINDEEVPEDARKHIMAMLTDGGEDTSIGAIRRVWRRYGEKVYNYEVKE